MLPQAAAAAEKLRAEGLSVGVINARFVKPVDVDVIARAASVGFVITIEENALMGGFGSAVLEAANRLGLNTERFKVLAIPDEFVEHGDRDELWQTSGWMPMVSFEQRGNSVNRWRLFKQFDRLMHDGKTN